MIETTTHISTKKQRVPALRFKEFEGDWGKKKMGDLSERIGDGLHGTPKYVEESDIHFVNGNNLVNGNIFITDKTKKISKNTFLKNDKKLAPNTLLISLNGTIGNIARYNNEKVMLGKSVGYFNFNTESDYYYHILNSPKIQQFFISELTGSTIKNLSLKTLRETIIPLPVFPEQQKIASFLSAVDEKILQLTKKKALLELYKKGVMQQLFSGKLRFKDEKGNTYPNWEEKQLSNVAKRVVRKNKENNLNVLTISAQQGLISQLEYFNKSVSAKNVTNYYLLHRDEFAYNKSYSTGYPMGAIKRLNKYDKGVVSTLYICFEFSDKVSLEFMEQFFEFGRQNIELEKVAQEGARNHGLLNIGVNDFFNIDIKVPTLPEQQKIAAYLSSIDTKIESINNQITQTQTFKKGLLQQMFV